MSKLSILLASVVATVGFCASANAQYCTGQRCQVQTQPTYYVQSQSVYNVPTQTSYHVQTQPVYYTQAQPVTVASYPTQSVQYAPVYNARPQVVHYVNGTGVAQPRQYVSDCFSDCMAAHGNPAICRMLCASPEALVQALPPVQSGNYIVER